MPILEPKKPVNGPSRRRGLSIKRLLDGYEQGGLVYFRMDGKEMVLIVREKKEFDRFLNAGKSLQEYANSIVTAPAYDAAKAIEASMQVVD